MARRLREMGVSFVFITGYDDGMIPAEFDDVARLQKPTEGWEIVNVVAHVVGTA